MTLDLHLGDVAFATAFSETIQKIYEAALTPESWPAALSKVGALCGGAGAAIVFWQQNTQAELICSPELAASVEVYIGEEWWRRDLFAQRAIARHVSAGDIVTDIDLATPVEIETHPMYAGFFHRFGWGWMMSCILLPDRDALVTVTLPRVREMGPYTERERALLDLVGRHVEQALRLTLRLSEVEASALVLRVALDAIDAEVFGLDAQRRLVMANKSGQARFDDCFAVVDGRVVARREDEEEALDALLAAAGTSGSAPRPCLLTGTDGRKRSVWAMPLTEATDRHFGLADPARVLLFATQLEPDNPLDPSVIRDIYKLSLGEARLASLVGAGVTVREAAATLGIGEATARLVLKHVFRKLGVHRQTDLALRIAAIGRIVPRCDRARSSFAGSPAVSGVGANLLRKMR